MTRTIVWLDVSMLAVSMLVVSMTVAVASVACADGRATEEAPRISVGPIQAAAAARGPGETRELTVTLQPTSGASPTSDAEPRRFVVQGPGNLMDLDEQASAQLVGDRLLVHTRSVIAVFDLESGERVVDLVAAPEVATSNDGRLVAFEVLQRRFTPAEATSSVIEVLDVETLEHEPVFPEASAIRPSQFNGPLAWIADPGERHSAGRLAFSPDGSEVVFFCTHAPAAPEEPQRVFLAVVDLSRGPARARFLHLPFDWTAHRRPDVAPAGGKPFFAVESMTWTDGGALLVRPPGYARWLEDEIVVPLPGPEDWEAKGSESPEDGEGGAPGHAPGPNEEQP